MTKTITRYPRLAPHIEAAFEVKATTDYTHISNTLEHLRVLAIGDCNTGGITVPPIGNTILDKFCRCLELAGYPTLKQNLGYGMATTREGLVLLEQYGQEADVALINFGLVDCWVTSIPKIYVPYFPDNKLKKVTRKVLKYTKRQLRTPILKRIVPTGYVVPIEEYRQNVEQMIEKVREANPKAWIVLWGSPPVQGDDVRNDNLLRYNAELHDIANEKRASYFPTKPLVESLTTTEAFVDNVHLNEVATAGIASAIAHTFLSQLQRTAA